MDIEHIRDALVDTAFKPDAGWQRNGRRFGWLLDCREILLDNRYLQACARLLWGLAVQYRPDAVAGALLSGVPLIAGALCIAESEDVALKGYIVRPSVKPYGLRKQIEGPAVAPGENIVILDDLASSGDSIIQVAQVLRDAGGHVSDAVVLIDFQRGAATKLERAGIRLSAVFTLSGLGIECDPRDPPIISRESSWAYGPANCRPLTAPHSSPLAHQDMFVVGTDTGSVVALDRAGEVRWRTDLNHTEPTSVHSSPVAHSGNVYVGSDDGFLNCLRSPDGSIVWRKRCGTCVGSSPIVGPSANGPLFVGAAEAEHAGALVALGCTTGEIVWRQPFTDYVQASPAIGQDHLIVVGADNNGIVRAFESDTGRLLWQYCALAAVKGRLSTDELRQVYFGSFDGFCHAVDIEAGVLRWKRKIGDRLYCSPCLTRDYVIMVTSTHAVGLRRRTGQIQWWSPIGGRVRGGAVVVNESHVAVGCGDGKIRLLLTRTGELAESLDARGPILSSVAVSAGLIVASCANGLICGFRRDHQP